MTAIASRPHVVEIEAQVRLLRDWNLMVGVQVAFTAVMSVAQLGEHTICGWVAETVPAEVSDDIRLPTAIDAAPGVALEAEDAEAAMVRIVSAITAGATAFVMRTLP